MDYTNIRIKRETYEVIKILSGVYGEKIIDFVDRMARVFVEDAQERYSIKMRAIVRRHGGQHIVLVGGGDSEVEIGGVSDTEGGSMQGEEG